jgi:hypothetical protein
MKTLTLSQFNAKTRPEVELLLCCARTQIDSITKKKIQTLVKQDIDWSYLIQMSARHGVMPLLYQSLNTVCPQAVPKSVLSKLRNSYHRNAQRNLSLTNELVHLLKLFQENKIAAIPYKGLVLALLLYKNLALRQMSDLDIIVHKEDILKAKDILILNGYQPSLTLKEMGYKRIYKFTSVQEAQWLNDPFQWEYKFYNKDNQQLIEIHWSISAKGSFLGLDSEWYWNSVKSISFAGTSILNFLPEDLLLVLCVNAMKDQWSYLKGVCDVAALLQAFPEMDWDWVMKQANLLHLERILFLGLLLSYDLLKAKIPVEIQQKIKIDPVVNLYANKVYKYLFYQPNLLKSSQKVWDNLPKYLYYFIHNLMRKKPVHTVPYRGYFIGQFFRLIITPTEEDRTFFVVPKFLSFLYYLVRPIRLLYRNGLNFVQQKVA